MPLLEQEVHCSFETSFNFFILSVVRGTTPLMMFLAVRNLHSASLVVALKCGISLVLFGLSALVLVAKPEVKRIVHKNLKETSTYWKLLLIGFLQSAVPYLLTIYSVQFLPITLVGVFMVTTPWWIHVIESLPIIRDPNKQRMTTLLKTGIFLGMFGVFIIMTPILIETVNCNQIKPSNTTNVTTLLHPKHGGIPQSILIGNTLDYCHSLKDSFNAIIALTTATIVWALAAIYWKRKQGDIHYIVSSVGQNVFGGIIATTVWLVHGLVVNFHPVNWDARIIHVVYLGAVTGWLGTLLVRNLFPHLGSRSINQVLTAIPFITFIEDCTFIRDMVTAHSYTLVAEIFGLFLVTIGVFITHIPQSDTSINRGQRDSLSEALLTSEYTTEGMRTGLNQESTNEIRQYDENLQDVARMDNSDTNDCDDEESLLPTEDINKVNFPILTEIPQYDKNLEDVASMNNADNDGDQDLLLSIK